MIWPTVARRYLDCFAGVLAERQVGYPTMLPHLTGGPALAAQEVARS